MDRRPPANCREAQGFRVDHQRDDRRSQATVVLGFSPPRSSSSWMLDAGPVAGEEGEGKRTKGSRSQGSNHVGRVIRPLWPALQLPTRQRRRTAHGFGHQTLQATGQAGGQSGQTRTVATFLA